MTIDINIKNQGDISMRKYLALVLAFVMILAAFTSCSALDGLSAKEPTVDENGVVLACVDADNDHICDDCGQKTRHKYNDGYCTLCSQIEVFYTRTDNKITFGSYPQSEVTDESLRKELKSASGRLPSASNLRAWTSYGYYIRKEQVDFMWYIDVELGGELYRGVYFTALRPFYYSSASNKNYTYQNDNGYTPKNVYWFKYEPISWTILSEDVENSTAFILCDLAIDSQAFQDLCGYDESDSEYNTFLNLSEGVPSGTEANNYAYSTIRSWLNTTFYETAFSELQRELILITTVDNGELSAPEGFNTSYCASTEDKLFLLSCKEISNPDYGFSNDYIETDAARRKKSTDYAKCQGVTTSDFDFSKGNCEWALRTMTSNSRNCYSVAFDGVSVDTEQVNFNGVGIVPAMNIKL